MAPPSSSRKKIATAAATTATVRCRKCGSKLRPYASGCLRCLPRRSHITTLIPRKSSIVYCDGCSSYLRPPRTWVRADPGSSRLRCFCVSLLIRHFPRPIKIDGSRFLPSPDPNSLIRLNLHLGGEISPGSISTRSYAVEFAIGHRSCEHCSVAAQGSEEAASAASYKVELRQYDPGTVSFQLLELDVCKHEGGPADTATMIREVDQGLDFFFPDQMLAVSFAEFVAGIFPTRPMTPEPPPNDNTFISLEICPISPYELICLPPAVSKSLGNLGPLVICTGVTNRIDLVDAINLRTASLDAEQYWAAPFQAMLSYNHLVQYIVVDAMVADEEADEEEQAVDAMDSMAGAASTLVPALVKVARVSDFRKGDSKTFTVKTHLGGRLHPGDYACGYYLGGDNIRNRADIRAYVGLQIPEVVLVRRVFKLERERRMGELRAWKDKTSSAQGKVDDGYEQFLRSLERNPGSVLGISFHEGQASRPLLEESRPSLVGMDACDPVDSDSMME